MNALWKLTLFAGALLLAPVAQSAQYKDFGDYRVHYSAFSANMLNPQIARNYNINRSGYVGVLNLAVQKKTNGDYQPVVAEVNASGTNLTGQRKKIIPREIREGEAVYYIGEFRVSDREILEFDVRIQPEGVAEPFSLKFRQQFFVD